MKYADIKKTLAGKKGKYHNQKSGGYDSRKEHRRALELRFLEKAGQISNLREQVSFLLIPSQRRDGRVVEKPCTYVADFVYDNALGETVVEDTKGMRTDVYRIKRKLMLYVHGIRITEV